MTRAPWYAAGLRFACTHCGHCCTREGHVWVDSGEAAALAAFLGLSLAEFGRRYLRRVDVRLALVDGPDGACVFWEDGCRVYPARPEQCRTYPFWRATLASRAAWREAAAECPGIGAGALYPQAEIEALALGEGETAPAPRDPGTGQHVDRPERPGASPLEARSIPPGILRP